MTVRWLLALMACLNGATASAQQSAAPYVVQAVALASDHRFFTSDAFRDQFPRELTQQTELAVGPLARVETTASHPLAAAIRRDGLDAVLDRHQEVSSRRTWFFVLRFDAGQFTLQGRYFDGLTGLAGPPSRTVTTGDRNRLASLAAAMIADPFPLVGQVKDVKGDRVTLTLVGGTAATVPIGSVFAVSRVTTEGDQPHATRIPWAALQTIETPVNGTVACKWRRRFAEDSLSSSRDVYRALLLATKSAPLLVQVFDKETTQPLAGLTVKVTDAANREQEVVTDAAGLAKTPRPVDRLALVTLSQGRTPLAQFPMPIVDDRVVTCDVSAKPDAEAAIGLDIRHRQFLKHVLESIQFGEQRMLELRVLVGQSLEDSLAFAKRTQTLLDAEIAELTSERLEIAERLKATQTKMTTVEGEKGIGRLKQIRGVLDVTVAEIAQAIQNRDISNEKQKQAAKLVVQAQLLESQAQFDDALKYYRDAAALAPDQSAVLDRLKTLERGWAIKDEAHKQARKYFVETWPTLETERLKDHFAIAKKGLDVCKDAGDHLTPRCFLHANVEHLSKAGRIIETLSKSRSAEDRQRLEAWRETLESLRRLTAEAAALAKSP